MDFVEVPHRCAASCAAFPQHRANRTCLHARHALVFTLTGAPALVHNQLHPRFLPRQQEAIPDSAKTMGPIGMNAELTFGPSSTEHVKVGHTNSSLTCRFHLVLRAHCSEGETREAHNVWGGISVSIFFLSLRSKYLLLSLFGLQYVLL